MSDQKVTADLVISKYIETRDKIAEIKKKRDEEVKALQELQDKRTTWLMCQMDNLGVESLRSVHGTCFVDYKESATVADWEEFRKWFVENEEWEYLEHRVSKSAVKQRLGDGEILPPGINFVRIKDLKVRRK